MALTMNIVKQRFLKMGPWRMLFLCLFLGLGNFTVAQPIGRDTTPIYTAMSFNIRMSGFSKEDGDNAWDNRKEAVVRMIRDVHPDFFGVQEMLPDQQSFLREHLPEYLIVGVGREDGAEKGECMAVFYDRRRFKMCDSHTFWLSQTPEKASYGWDAACRRTVTYIHLRERDSKQNIYYFNTHLDHRGQEARRKSVELLCQLIDSLCPQSAMVLLGGDMNSSIEDTIFIPLEKIGLISAREHVTNSDYTNTYNAYGKGDGSLIDHFFISQSVISPISMQTITKNYGVPYISDHYPIVLIFRQKEKSTINNHSKE